MNQCLCHGKYALYMDMGIVKCQNCMGEIHGERKDKYLKANEFVVELRR